MKGTIVLILGAVFVVAMAIAIFGAIGFAMYVCRDVNDDERRWL
jgi:preprotein translocase subunit Sss1